jgi:hypothetical protein
LTRVNSLQKDELIKRKVLKILISMIYELWYLSLQNRPLVQEQREYDSSTTAGIK